MNKIFAAGVSDTVTDFLREIILLAHLGFQHHLSEKACIGNKKSYILYIWTGNP
jgi:hypothetical protein